MIISDLIHVGKDAAVVMPTIYNLYAGLPEQLRVEKNLERLRAWFNGDRTTPPVLVGAPDFMWKDTPTYPRRFQVENTVSAEQAAVLIRSMPNGTPGEDMDPKVRDDFNHFVAPLALLNASATFHKHVLPQRFHMPNAVSLMFLVSMVITQRRRKVFEAPQNAGSLDVISNEFHESSLAFALTILNKAEMENFYPDPQEVENDTFDMTADFYCQCAMAHSAVTGVQIPEAYGVPYTNVFAWAYSVLAAQRRFIEKGVENIKKPAKPTFTLVK